MTSQISRLRGAVIASRSLLAATTAVFVAAGFAGCGGGEEVEQPAAQSAAAAKNESQLEMFSWWTAGGEAEALTALFDVFEEKYADREIVNAAVAGGAGTNARAVLASRLTGGDPPDAFQVLLGQQILTYSPDKFVEPLDRLYAEQGWAEVFPQRLVELLKVDGHYWSVPVNVHRLNVLWFNEKIFADNGLTPPATFEEFFEVAEKLRAKGMTPMAFGSHGGWEHAVLFEAVLIGALGAEGFKGLWTGATSWTDPRVTRALETYKKMVAYANEDHPSMSFDGAAQVLIDGKAAMFIHGDWVNGYFLAKKFDGYGWAPPPGNAGVFDVVSDAFAIPKGSKHPVNAKAWLELAGSKAGQEAFNPIKGSICARTDCDLSRFNDYLKSSTADFARDELVLVSDSAAPPAYASAFREALALFAANGDIAAAQKAFQQACVDGGVCK